MYPVKFMGITVFNRHISASHIEEVILRRVGWSQKSVKVRIKKGINLRIVSDDPKVYKELIAFSKRNNIPLVRTRDFILLENKSK